MEQTKQFQKLLNHFQKKIIAISSEESMKYNTSGKEGLKITVSIKVLYSSIFQIKPNLKLEIQHLQFLNQI